MKGHIRKRGKDSWSLVIDLGRDAEGKRKQKWHSIKGRKKDAQAKLTELLNDLNECAYVEPTKILVSDFLIKWLGTAKTRISPTTYQRYEAMVHNNIIPFLGRYKLQMIDVLMLEDFYTHMLTSGRMNGKGGLSAQTVKHIHRLLKIAFDKAVRLKLIRRNPVIDADTPKVEKKEMTALELDETARLFELSKNWWIHYIVFVAATTGLRRGEVLALRWKDIDFSKGTLRVSQSLEQTKQGLRFKEPKTKKSRRTITLYNLTIDALRQHKKGQAKNRLAIGPLYQDNNLVFPGNDGTPYPPNNLSSAFKQMVRDTDFNHVRLHDLRHTHASQLLQQEGVNIKTVSERLGHSSVAFTLDIYGHVLEGMQEDASSKGNAALQAILNLKL